MTDRQSTPNTSEAVSSTEQHFKQRLDESLDNLDYATQLKLQQAREAALSQPSKSSLHSGWESFKDHWLKWSASGVAVAATVAAITVTQLSVPEPDTLIADATESIWLEDIELLAAEEELEFIEDLEFYEWLENNAETNAEVTLES